MIQTTEVARERLDANLMRLYWATRIGIAFIWVWTAAVSWFFFPHAASLEWLARLGLSAHGDTILLVACMLDFLLGLASAGLPSVRLWQAQCVLVAGYSFAILLALPEFLFHPFGPLTKNIAVLASLSLLIIMERRRAAGLA